MSMSWYDYDNAPDPADLVDQNGPDVELVAGVDYEIAACPVCADSACTFGPACADKIGEWPGPVWGSDE